MPKSFCTFFHSAALVLSLLACPPGSAAEADASGRWLQIDDKSKQVRSVIHFRLHGERYEGAVEKIYFQPGEYTDPICVKCTDSRKDQKIIGMVILRDLKREGTQYVGGEILDPEDGSTWRVKMSLSPDGKKLDVRGFIGISLFGRTQTWIRDNRE